MYSNMLVDTAASDKAQQVKKPGENKKSEKLQKNVIITTLLSIIKHNA